jgi:hypothetical protein
MIPIDHQIEFDTVAGGENDRFADAGQIAQGGVGMRHILAA